MPSCSTVQTTLTFVSLTFAWLAIAYALSATLRARHIVTEARASIAANEKLARELLAQNTAVTAELRASLERFMNGFPKH